MSTSKEISTRHAMTHHHQKQVQHGTQWLNQTNNHARPWLITTNSSGRQNNYSGILFTTAHLHTVRDSSSAIIQEYCSTRTI